MLKESDIENLKPLKVWLELQKPLITSVGRGEEEKAEEGRRKHSKPKIANFKVSYISNEIEFRHAVNGIGIVSSRSFHIEMLVPSALIMAAMNGR